MTNPYAPPRAAVQDIIDPSALGTPAGRGARLWAFILDGIIFGALVYVPMLPLIIVGAATGGTDGTGGVGPLSLVGFAAGCVGFIVWSWLTIKYVKANGQSIAKKIVGIKVVRTDGSEASLGRIFWLRNFVNGVISIIPFYGLIELLFIFGEARQCLHDKIADTIVIEA